jgi:hypothetical protein
LVERSWDAWSWVECGRDVRFWVELLRLWDRRLKRNCPGSCAPIGDYSVRTWATKFARLMPGAEPCASKCWSGVFGTLLREDSFERRGRDAVLRALIVRVPEVKVGDARFWRALLGSCVEPMEDMAAPSHTATTREGLQTDRGGPSKGEDTWRPDCGALAGEGARTACALQADARHARASTLATLVGVMIRVEKSEMRQSHDGGDAPPSRSKSRRCRASLWSGNFWGAVVRVCVSHFGADGVDGARHALRISRSLKRSGLSERFRTDVKFGNASSRLIDVGACHGQTAFFSGVFTQGTAASQTLRKRPRSEAPGMQRTEAGAPGISSGGGLGGACAAPAAHRRCYRHAND